MQSKEETDNKNSKDALELAKNIYNIVTDARFIKTYDENMRHKVVMQKYPNFANAYPVILRLIARDLKYNENAFKKFLEKLKKDPGKGMEGFISRQADYAKFLYIEDCKKYGKRCNLVTANEIWNIEYKNMHDAVKKLEKDEKLAKNEFEEEQKINLINRKKELLDFVNTCDLDNPDESENVDLENYERIILGLPPKSLGDIDVNTLTIAEIIQYIRHLKDYKLSLHEDIQELKQPIVDDIENLITDLNTDRNILIDYVDKLKHNIIQLEKYLTNIKNELKIQPTHPEIKNVTIQPEWLEGIVKIPKIKTKIKPKK